MMTDKEKSNMEALEAKEKKLKEEMSEIENQKQAIKAKEEQRIDAERFHSLVALLDAGDAILSATKHTRTSFLMIMFVTVIQPPVVVETFVALNVL